LGLQIVRERRPTESVVTRVSGRERDPAGRESVMTRDPGHGDPGSGAHGSRPSPVEPAGITPADAAQKRADRGGALTPHSEGPLGPAARSAAGSSIQSTPAGADIDRSQELVTGVGRTGCRPESSPSSMS